MKTKTKIALTLGLLSLLALGGLTQSKYVRNATIEMDVTSETDPGVFAVNNTLVGNAGSAWMTYTIPKTGYYALQLRGGDGGTNVTATGGKGGIVEAVYYFTKDQKIRYTLGGRGGWYDVGAINEAAGGSNHAAGGKGGQGWLSSAKDGSGGGGSSMVETEQGSEIMVAGGGGGGAGNTVTNVYGGVGASNVDGSYGPYNYPGSTSKLLARDLPDRKSGAGKDGEGGTVFLNNCGGGGSGGGFTESYAGGRYGGNRQAGAGAGGHSYVAPNVNSHAFQPLTNALKAMYSAKLPTTGPNSGDFIPYNDGSGTRGSTSTAGQFRIAFLWSDTTANHKGISIYK